MLLIYRLGIWVYWVLVRLLAPFNRRARKFADSRRGLLPHIEQTVQPARNKRIWLHAASLGEFEQGRPVMEAIKSAHPDFEIVLTFFSPSGYEVRKNYALADYVFYLPMDFPARVNRFLEAVKPDLAIFIKYEFWYYYLTGLHRRKVPVLLVSGIFRPNQLFFHPAGRFFMKALAPIDHFFVQDTASAKLLNDSGIEQVTVAGDTRFDRVIGVAEEARELPVVARFCGHDRVMVLGSVWSSDMELLEPFILKEYRQTKFIIAPHNLDESTITGLLKLPLSVKYSLLEQLHDADVRILVVDNMGMLSAIYRYGHFAWIGGALRGALHNTLEAAVYGMPVFFGVHPKNAKFAEASGLISAGGAFAVPDEVALVEQFVALKRDEEKYRMACAASRDYVYHSQGATQKVMERIAVLV